MSTVCDTPCTVAIRNDYEVVVRGVEKMLAPYSDQVAVVELDLQTDVSRPVHITLYDTFSQAQVDGSDIDELLNDENCGQVVIFSWNTDPKLIDLALNKGVAGYLSKSLSAKELVDALVDIGRGKVVVAGADDAPGDPRHEDDRSGQAISADWAGLTAREAEVVALITQGLSNQEIADRAYLSINSVKSYIRTAYRKMDVTTRSQAVLWGVRHEMVPGVGRLRRENPPA